MPGSVIFPAYSRKIVGALLIIGFLGLMVGILLCNRWQSSYDTSEIEHSQQHIAKDEVQDPEVAEKSIEADMSFDFTISPDICQDSQGPDCTHLRLGDDYFTTIAPAKGHLYSCTDKNPRAPGSIESKITWIDLSKGTWNLIKKLWLPQGEFTLSTGVYTESISDNKRFINTNNLPVDGKIGDWPMTDYPQLTEIDPNPGMPASSDYSFSYPAYPVVAILPSCVSLGAIGVTKNGVVLFSASDARGEDALAREIVDEFGGHPAMSDYHYHFIPERLDDESLSDGHSGIVGYINDGFPIYGYRSEGGVEMSNTDLDSCHGHDHGTLEYHYHATVEYPYTVGCYVGSEVQSQPNSNLPDDRRRPPQR